MEALRSIQLPARFLPAACFGLALAAGACLTLFGGPPAEPDRTRRRSAGRPAWAFVVLVTVVLGATMIPGRHYPVEPGVSTSSAPST